jgi:hypothetical protein
VFRFSLVIRPVFSAHYPERHEEEMLHATAAGNFR